MTDRDPPAEPGEPFAGAAGERYPWDEDALAPLDSDAPRERHDAFSQARKCAFLEALAKAGCILDACRHASVAPRTVYRHQESDPVFRAHCETALRMAGTPLELTAWSRAVEGVEQEFACGGEVHVRRRYDGGLLRLLLIGSNRKKYGPRPGFKRKQLLKHERKQMEREIRSELAAGMTASDEEVTRSLTKALRALGLRKRAEQEQAERAAAWTRAARGHAVQAGEAPLEGTAAPGPAPDAEEPPCESM